MAMEITNNYSSYAAQGMAGSTKKKETGKTQETAEGSKSRSTVSDGKLMETQTANYFSDIYPIDCAVLSANA